MVLKHLVLKIPERLKNISELPAAFKIKYKLFSIQFMLMSMLLNGEGNGNPLQYPHWENSMDRGAWWATVHGTAKSWT